MRFYIALTVFVILGMALCSNAKVPDYCEGYTASTFSSHCVDTEVAR